jgi:hypothetical protein
VFAPARTREPPACWGPRGGLALELNVRGFAANETLFLFEHRGLRAAVVREEGFRLPCGFLKAAPTVPWRSTM